MFRKILVTVILLASVLVFSTQFKRSVEDKIVIEPGGNAVITRTEYVPSSDLAKVYIQHSEALSDREVSDEVFNNFYDEISKGYFFLYSSVPGFVDRDIDISIDKGGNYKSVITMKISGLITQSIGCLEKKGLQKIQWWYH